MGGCDCKSICDFLADLQSALIKLNKMAEEAVSGGCPGGDDLGELNDNLEERGLGTVGELGRGVIGAGKKYPPCIQDVIGKVIETDQFCADNPGACGHPPMVKLTNCSMVNVWIMKEQDRMELVIDQVKAVADAKKCGC